MPQDNDDRIAEIATAVMGFLYDTESKTPRGILLPAVAIGLAQHIAETGGITGALGELSRIQEIQTAFLAHVVNTHTTPPEEAAQLLGFNYTDMMWVEAEARARSVVYFSSGPAVRRQMDAEDARPVLASLAREGITLSALGDDLYARPAAALTDWHRDLIAGAHDGLVELLTGPVALVSKGETMDWVRT